MGTQNVFWSLVGQNIRGVKRRNNWFQQPWRTIYFATIFLIAVIVSTYTGLFMKSAIDVNAGWFFTFALPFVAFGNGTAQIVHEWKNETVGWWLSLPYSRMQLVSSKFVATLIRTVLFFIFFYVIISVLGVYTIALHGQFNAQTIVLFLVSGLKWFGLLLCVCPFAAAIGILLGVLTESRAKPLMPLIYVVIGSLWWLASSHGFTHLNWFKFVDGHLVFYHASFMFLYPFVASLMIAYVFLSLAAYLLERQLAL